MTFSRRPGIFVLIQNPRTNNQITAPEMVVVDESGKSLGTMKKEEALALAREKGLDLIEIAPNAKPPVVRLMSFDKFRYQQEKKEKKQRVLQKGGGMKQVQISIREAIHDLQMKAERVNQFMAEGNPVEILMTLRGREKANKDFAREKLANFMKIINPEHRVTMEPRVGGRGIAMQITKK